ncbi:hypothetical protein HK405_009852, partial [Cladochytrium tenue]
ADVTTGDIKAASFRRLMSTPGAHWGYLDQLDTNGTASAPAPSWTRHAAILAPPSSVDPPALHLFALPITDPDALPAASLLGLTPDRFRLSFGDDGDDDLSGSGDDGDAPGGGFNRVDGSLERHRRPRRRTHSRGRRRHPSPRFSIIPRATAITDRVTIWHMRVVGVARDGDPDRENPDGDDAAHDTDAARAVLDRDITDWREALFAVLDGSSGKPAAAAAAVVDDRLHARYSDSPLVSATPTASAAASGAHVRRSAPAANARIPTTTTSPKPAPRKHPPRSSSLARLAALPDDSLASAPPLPALPAAYVRRAGTSASASAAEGTSASGYSALARAPHLAPRSRSVSNSRSAAGETSFAQPLIPPLAPRTVASQDSLQLGQLLQPQPQRPPSPLSSRPSLTSASSLSSRSASSLRPAAGAAVEATRYVPSAVELRPTSRTDSPTPNASAAVAPGAGPARRPSRPSLSAAGATDGAVLDPQPAPPPLAANRAYAEQYRAIRADVERRRREHALVRQGSAGNGAGAGGAPPLAAVQTPPLLRQQELAVQQQNLQLQLQQLQQQMPGQILQTQAQAQWEDRFLEIQKQQLLLMLQAPPPSSTFAPPPPPPAPAALAPAPAASTLIPLAPPLGSLVLQEKWPQPQLMQPLTQQQQQQQQQPPWVGLQSQMLLVQQQQLLQQEQLLLQQMRLQPGLPPSAVAAGTLAPPQQQNFFPLQPLLAPPLLPSGMSPPPPQLPPLQPAAAAAVALQPPHGAWDRPART